MEKKGDLNKSIHFLSKAIELNPKYKEAYKERAEVYRLMGETSKAFSVEDILSNL